MPDLPLVVIGGYLGAGKTTLVNHLLRHAQGRRIAVLVNDFGEVNIDAELIASAATADALAQARRDGQPPGAAPAIIPLSGGCICCSFGADLVGTLEGLARLKPAPDVVLVECSGVALPAAVVRSARLARGIQVVGTLCVADAAAIRQQAADRWVGDTVTQQLQQADWLLLNKPDLLDARQRAATRRWAQQRLPAVRVVACAVEAVPPDLVLGWPDTRPAEPQAPARPWRRATLRPPAASPFVSAVLPLASGVDLQGLGRALVDPASGVVRAKGLASGAGGGRQLLQVAAGRWAVTPLEGRSGGHAATTSVVADPVAPAGQLVLIGLRGRFQIRDWQAWSVPVNNAPDATAPSA